jgi:hypothetical protein
VLRVTEAFADLQGSLVESFDKRRRQVTAHRSSRDDPAVVPSLTPAPFPDHKTPPIPQTPAIDTAEVKGTRTPDNRLGRDSHPSLECFLV